MSTTNDTDPNKIVVLNISGTIFETFASTLKRFPGTRLERLSENSHNYRPERDEYFFDRNPLFFSQILNFYRYGSLHLPSGNCGPAMKRELDYWGVSMIHLEQCCLHYFKACVSNETALEVCDIVMEATIDYRLAELFSIRRSTTEKVRQFLEDPSYSKLSKVGASRHVSARLIAIIGHVLVGATVPYTYVLVGATVPYTYV